MAHVDLFFRLVFVALAFCVVALVTGKLAQRVIDEVAQAEQSKVQDAERPSVGQMHGDCAEHAGRRGGHLRDADVHQRLDSRVARRRDF